MTIFQARNPPNKDRGLNLISPKGDKENANWLVIIVGPFWLKIESHILW